MQTWKFNLETADAVNIMDTLVGYVRYYEQLSGASSDPRIRLTTLGSSGVDIELLPGQGYRLPVPVRGLVVKNLSGNAISGKLAISPTSGNFEDDRITGEVSVIDGGKSRTAAGGSFTWQVLCTAVAGFLPAAQLWNPPGSGRNLFVTRGYASATVAGGLYLGIHNTALTTAGGSVANKKSLSVASSVASALNQTPASMFGAARTFGTVLVQNYGNWPITLDEPLMIEPGSGLLLQHDTTTGLSTTGMFNFFEEPIQ